MKKIVILTAFVLLVLPGFIFAKVESEKKITLEQKGEFKSIATVEQNDFAVPKMIDVPLAFDDDSVDSVIVTDSTGVIVPSIIINKSKKSRINFTAADSKGNKDANNMVDGKINTFTEMPFVEGSKKYEITSTDVTTTDKVNGGTEMRYSKEHYEGNKELEAGNRQNKVVIDIKSDRLFKSDSVSFFFDKNIEKPTRIRVTSVQEDGTEKILLPESFFSNNTINFPEANVKHYRITFYYIKPLRINEIVFHEKGVPITTKKFVRFIAQPQMVYNIYHNADNFVKTKLTELPNFDIGKVKTIVKPKLVKDNPLYKKADADKDGILDSVDNCINIANIDQIDKDKNGKGDACEDFDHDGIVNAKDNCPMKVNHAQTDSDFDGIGDACDGEESRFMEKYPWIPYVVLVVVFGIVSGLIIKTLRITK